MKCQNKLVELQNLLVVLVYQVLLQTCIHPPVVEGERKSLYAEDGSEVVTYKSFTSLWTHMLTLPRDHAVSWRGRCAVTLLGAFSVLFLSFK